MRTSQKIMRAFALPLLIGALASAATAEVVIRAVMNSGLRVLDPMINPTGITRAHGYMVYDTLFAYDDQFRVKPQMVKTWKVSPDELTYTFELRDGLKWHDGGRVTPEDCIASIKRWAKRDSMGQKMMEHVAEFKAIDKKTFSMRLNSPFPFVLQSLGKIGTYMPAMMPKRIAETPADKPITEYIGSGPFKFVASEYQPGVKAVYVKNRDYVPRREPPNWTSGGKVVNVDRVEWVNIPDDMTAANALMDGEIDYIEIPPYDLLPTLSAARGVRINAYDKLRWVALMRMNHAAPPFNNPKVRLAVAYAIKQEDYLKSYVSDPRYRRVCFSMYGCDTPLSSDAGSAGLMRGNVEKAKQLLKEANYDGTPVVILQPTDINSMASYPVVTAQFLRAIGMKVDLQAMDMQTMLGRRAKKDAWSIFHANYLLQDMINPLGNPWLEANGSKAYFGWPQDPDLERLRDKYASEANPDRRKTLAAHIQRRAYEIQTFLPLGERIAPAAYRDSLEGVLDSPIPLFWNIKKKASK